MGGGPPGAGLRVPPQASDPAWLLPLAPVPDTPRREGGRKGERQGSPRTLRKILSSFFFFFLNKFTYLFLAVLGLRFCVRAFPSCGERGPLSIAVHGPLTIAASPVAEHRLQTRRLSSCGAQAQLFRGMWDPPRPGLEPMSPAPAGRFLTTAPPGKPQDPFF